MKFAEFSTASLALDADLDAATQTEIACTVCHAAVDPLAGLWRNFGNSGQYRVAPLASAMVDMPTSAFLGTPLPDGESDIIGFAGAHIAAHERFPLAMLVPLLQGLVGFEELDSTLDALDPEFPEKALALEIQRKLLSDLRARFVLHGLRVKPLIKDIIDSEMFRARGVIGTTLTPVEQAALARAGVGRGVMITPEQLDRKLTSLLGFTYRRNRTATGTALLTDIGQYQILLGGINYDSIAKRFREPSPTFSRVIERMANEISCIAVPQDFAITDATQRRLFRNVEITTEDPALIQAELIRLHKLLLEEDVQPGDTELQESLAVFNDTLALGRGLIGTSANLTSDCDATASFEATPVPYPTDGRVRVQADPDYIIRAWMVTVSYLLSDPRWFFE